MRRIRTYLLWPPQSILYSLFIVHTDYGTIHRVDTTATSSPRETRERIQLPPFNSPPRHPPRGICSITNHQLSMEIGWLWNRHWTTSERRDHCMAADFLKADRSLNVPLMRCVGSSEVLYIWHIIHLEEQNRAVVIIIAVVVFAYYNIVFFHHLAIVRCLWRHRHYRRSNLHPLST